jgi:hypothetical protein
MNSTTSNPVTILKVIGTLFSLIALMLLALTLWMIFDSSMQNGGTELDGLKVSAGILTSATGTIAVFIWWIISNRKKFIY